MAKVKKKIIFPAKQEVLKDLYFAMKHGSNFEDAYALVFKSYHKKQKGRLPKNKIKDSGLKAGGIPVSKKIFDWIGDKHVDASQVVQHFGINVSTAHFGMLKLVKDGVFQREVSKGIYYYSKAA
jgi:hypothetical protein